MWKHAPLGWLVMQRPCSVCCPAWASLVQVASAHAQLAQGHAVPAAPSFYLQTLHLAYLVWRALRSLRASWGYFYR